MMFLSQTNQTGTDVAGGRKLRVSEGVAHADFYRGEIR
jgi:hypothetical protein